jgi:hypothetical protein
MFIPADQNYSCGVDEDTVKKIGRTVKFIYQNAFYDREYK